MLSLETPVAGAASDEQGVPTGETISMRWGVRIVALLFCVSLAMLAAAEYISASKIADMAQTAQVASEVARGFSYAILAALGLERGMSKARS